MASNSDQETWKGVNAVYAKDRATWRRWLKKHHNTEKNVWLIIYHKASVTPSVKYADAVEEALCFGWIDSKPNKRNEESFYLYFAARNPKSKWSKINKERVERLLADGLMMPAGQKMIDVAKTTGTWDALTDIDNIVIPEDLQAMFSKAKKGWKNFIAFSPSSRRMILQWISDAKRPETRLKRIKETVAMATQNKKANQPN